LRSDIGDARETSEDRVEEGVLLFLPRNCLPLADDVGVSFIRQIGCLLPELVSECLELACLGGCLDCCLPCLGRDSRLGESFLLLLGANETSLKVVFGLIASLLQLPPTHRTTPTLLGRIQCLLLLPRSFLRHRVFGVMLPRIVYDPV